MSPDTKEDNAKEENDIESSNDLDHHPDVLAAHKDMIRSALADAARWCYGIKAVEVWIKTDMGSLKNIEGGAWVHPDHMGHHDTNIKNAIDTLYNPKSLKFKEYHHETYAPGVGLPGMLFAESKTPSRVSTRNLMSKRSLHKTVNWRNISGLVSDPDQPYVPRLEMMLEAGLGVVAGIPFCVDDLNGVVIFMAHEYEISLSTMQNEKYMFIATQHIGVVQALLQPRLEVAEVRSQKVDAKFHKALRFITATRNFNLEQDIDEIIDKNENETNETKEKEVFSRFQDLVNNNLKRSLNQWFQKMRGANIPPPPAPSISLCFFIFVISFVTCFIMVSIKDQLIETIVLTDGCKKLSFENALTASVVMLAYALTPSPAAQPRSVIFGQLIAMFSGMTFALIPRDLPDTDGSCPPPNKFDTPIEWIRFSGAIATSTAISFALGVAHPPAAGLVLIFLNYPWNELITYPKIGMTLLQDIILIMIMSILCNMHPKKQYPTFWGYIPNYVVRKIQGLFSSKEKI